MKKIIAIPLFCILTACSAIPASEQPVAVYIMKTDKLADKKLILHSPLKYTFTEKTGGNLIKYNATYNGELKAGEYTAVAVGNGGTYYQYTGKKSRFLKQKPGGIKIPNDENGSYKAWVGYKSTRYEGNQIITEEFENRAFELPEFESKPNYTITAPQ